MLTEQHIYMPQLGGFSHPQIQSFYQRANYARQSLPLQAQPDDFKLGHWLFLKLKAARCFEHEIRAYKRSKLTSRLRRFSHLWERIRQWLLEHQEDKNAAKVAEALNNFKPPQAKPPSAPHARGRAGGAAAIDGDALQEFDSPSVEMPPEVSPEAAGKTPAAAVKATAGAE